MQYFEDNYKFVFIPLRIMQAHPGMPRDLKWIVKLLIINLFVMLASASLIYSLLVFDIKNKQINNIFTNGILLALYNYTQFMYCSLLYWQKPLKDAFRKIEADYENAKTLLLEERQLFEQYANEANKMTKLSSCSVFLTGILFLSTSLFHMIGSLFSGNFMLLAPIMDITYPEFIDSRKNELSGFILCWLTAIAFDSYIVLVYVGFVGIGPICMVHASGQLAILKTKVDKLFIAPANGYDNQAIRKSLKEISKTLEDIYRFVGSINQCLFLHHEVLFTVAPLFMPFSLFLGIWNIRQGQLHLEYFSNLLGFFVSVVLPSYYSDMLMQQGFNLRQALYDCGWVKHYDRESRIMIMCLLLWTSKPIAFRSLFRTINLVALTQLMNQTYRVWNLLNTAYS